MIEVTGDLWTYPAEWRCVTTNGIVQKNRELVMGAGCALEAKMKYPAIPAKLGELVKIFGNLPFFLHEYKLISFPTKNHWKDPSSIELIEQSARHIASFARIHEITSVLSPRPGCGYGRLLWDDVKKVLEPIFNDDRFIIISN